MKRELKNMILYGAGRAVSSLGTIIYSFAIGLYVLNTTGSGMKFAITLIVSFLPSLTLTPFAGVLADRFDKKKIVVSMDFLNGTLFLLFFAYINVTEITLLGVYITSFLTNVIASFFDIAFIAAKPQLVREERFQTINALNQIIRSTSNILGPVIGGMVYAFMDIKLFILLNGLSFVASAISETFIDFNFNSENIDTHKSSDYGMVLDALKEGFHYVIKHKVIMSMYGFFLAINILLAVAMQVPLPYILNNYLNIGSEAYGIVFAFTPIGMIVGALTVGMVAKNIDINKFYGIIGIANGVLAMAIGIPYLLTILISTEIVIMIYYSSILFFFGVSISWIDIPLITHIQKTVDASYLGRVWGILIPLVRIANPIGFLLSGLLIEWVNPFLIPLICGLVFIVFSVLKRVTSKDLDIE